MQGRYPLFWLKYPLLQCCQAALGCKQGAVQLDEALGAHLSWLVVAGDKQHSLFFASGANQV